MDTLSLIIQHGLSVRQIPLQTVHRYEMRHHKEGNEIVRVPLNVTAPAMFQWHQKHHANSPNFEIDEANRTVTRLYTQEIKVPNHAGYWMTQVSGGTSSTQHWSYKDCFLAPTLEESVALCVAALKKT